MNKENRTDDSSEREIKTETEKTQSEESAKPANPADSESAGETELLTGESPAEKPQDAPGELSNNNKTPDRERAERANAGKQRAYQERIRKHRKRIKALRILVALLAVMLIGVFVWYLMHRSYSRAELSRVTDFVSEEGTSYESVNGYVVQYGPNGASCVDGRGNVSWSVTFEMDSPIISTAGNMIALADYGGHTIYLMNTGRQLNTITTSQPIHMLTVSENGEVAAVLDDADSTWIRLYASDGQEIAYFVRDMEENGYPIALAISPDGTQVCVSSLLMKSVSVKSHLSFYDFSSRGRDYDQNMVGDFDYSDEIFPYVKFIDNDSCAAVSDSRLVLYDTSSTQTQSGTNNMFTESLQGVVSGGRYIGLLFNDETGENLYTLDIYGPKGKMAGKVGFSMTYTNLQIAGGIVYINNDQSMQIYSVEGRKIFDGGLDHSIRALVPASRLKGLFAVAENEIDSIELQ